MTCTNGSQDDGLCRRAFEVMGVMTEGVVAWIETELNTPVSRRAQKGSEVGAM